MNPALQQLKDIHLPPAIHRWPVAPGWIILYVLAIALIIYLVIYWYHRKKRRYTVNFAMQRLSQLKGLMSDNPQNINVAAEISTLIRRTALYYYHRDVIAGLSGQNWLRFLNESGHTTEFTAETGQLLVDAPYRKQHNADLTPLFNLTENWLAEIARVNSREK